VGFTQFTDLVAVEPVEPLSSSLVGVFEGLEMDEASIFESEVQMFGVPVGDPLRRNQLLEGGDDVAMKFGVGWSRGPSDGVGNGGLTDGRDGPNLGLAEPSPGDDRQSVEESGALPLAGWTGDVGGSGLVGRPAGGAAPRTDGVEKCNLRGLTIELLGRKLDPLRNRVTLLFGLASSLQASDGRILLRLRLSLGLGGKRPPEDAVPILVLTWGVLRVELAAWTGRSRLW
jgi:hypothetical protein